MLTPVDTWIFLGGLAAIGAFAYLTLRARGLGLLPREGERVEFSAGDTSAPAGTWLDLTELIGERPATLTNTSGRPLKIYRGDSRENLEYVGLLPSRSKMPVERGLAYWAETLDGEAAGSIEIRGLL